MNEPKIGKNNMDCTQEVAELRKENRNDIAELHRKMEERDLRLHSKLDKHIEEGNLDARCIQRQLAKMDKTNTQEFAALDKSTSINKMKLGIFTGIVAVVVTASMHYIIPIIATHA